MKKMTKWVVGIVASALIVTAIILANPALYKGSIAGAPPNAPQANAECGAQWTTIFSGKADLSGRLEPTIPLTEQRLISMLEKGCSLKIVKDYRSADNTRFINSFDCLNANYQNATNSITCLSSPMPDNNFSIAEIGFVQNQASTYHGTENDAAGEVVKISIFAKK